MPGPGAWCGKHNEFCNITSILPQDCNFHTLLWFLFIITRLQTPDSTNETSLLLRETNKSPPGSLWCYLCHTSQPGQVLETERREHRTEWKSWNLEREQTQSWCGHCGEEKHWRGDGDTAQTHRPGHGCPGNTGGVSRGGARGGVRSVGSGSWGDREHASLYSDVMTCITLHHPASLYSDVMTCITLHHYILMSWHASLCISVPPPWPLSASPESLPEPLAQTRALEWTEGPLCPLWGPMDSFYEEGIEKGRVSELGDKR